MPDSLRRDRRPLTWSRSARGFVHLSDVVLVAAGGFCGSALRGAVAEILPTPTHGFPTATLMVNLAGALLLGVLIEVLARAGDRREGRKWRLLLGTGVLGGFTTYSSFAVQVDLLLKSGHIVVATGYAVATVVGGLLAAGAGIAMAAGRGGWSRARLPVDPDADPPDMDE